MKKLICSALTLLIFFTSVAPVIAAITYSYDANGNMTSDGTTCYLYNEANELKRVEVYEQGFRLLKGW